MAACKADLDCGDQGWRGFETDNCQKLYRWPSACFLTIIKFPPYYKAGRNLEYEQEAMQIGPGTALVIAPHIQPNSVKDIADSISSLLGVPVAIKSLPSITPPEAAVSIREDDHQSSG